MIYLDNCCFNRPFDDQTQVRIRVEAEAKMDIQGRIERGELQLAWSYILDFENAANPYEERREAIAEWRRKSHADIDESEDVLQKAREIMSIGIKAKDALHVSCAIAAGCALFITTDDLVLTKLRDVQGIAVVGPTEFIRKVTG